MGRACLEQPALLWLPVCVPPLEGWQVHPEVVRIERTPQQQLREQQQEREEREQGQQHGQDQGLRGPKETEVSAEASEATWLSPFWQMKREREWEKLERFGEGAIHSLFCEISC